MRANAFPLQRGFTLVEAIIVIVITGIIAAVVAVFIRTPVQSYFDSAARAELVDVADTALRRMARELRLALPNSIRVTTSGADTYIEFLLTNDGGRYLAEGDNPATGNILDFNNASNLVFDVVGLPMPGIAAGNSIVVYNLGFDPANAYCASTSGCNNRAVVNGVATTGGVTTVTLAANPFPAQTPVVLPSPNSRFQVVTTPVTYACTGNNLVRFAGYAIQQNQPADVAAAPLSSAPTKAVLASRAVCNFVYTNTAANIAANMRYGLVGLGITLTGSGNASAETVQLFHQVHVDNTP